MSSAKDFFDETSPIRLVRWPVAQSLDTASFLDSTVRCMTYRAFARWYHGSFSSRAQFPSLMTYYLLGIIVQLGVHHFVCSPDSVPPWAYGVNETLTAYVVLASFFGSQTHRIATLSIYLSRFATTSAILTVISKAYGRKVECSLTLPSYTSPFTMTMLNFGQACLTSIAILIQICAVPIAQLYILKSSKFLKR